MIRLLVLCDTVGSEGGTESYLSRVLPELARTGIGIELLARRVLDAAAFGIPSTQVEWAAENEPPSLDAAARIRETIERMDPDAVLTSNVFDPAVLAAARRARKFIVRIHDHRAFCPNGDRRFPQFQGNCTAPMGGACLLNALVHGCIGGPHSTTIDRLQTRLRVRDALCAADTFVVSSKFMADSCVRNGVAQDRIVIAPPPVGMESYAPSLNQRPPRRILFAGRILPQKGLFSLARALTHIPKHSRPTLAVAGAPTEELDRVVHFSAEHNIVLEVLGNLPQMELHRAIDACRAAAIPSLWAEPFGLVGIEAQARGRPSVAYAVGGIPEWIGDAGLAVRAGDERALARAIEHVIADEHWERYARAALDRARAFHPSHHVQVLREVVCA